MSLIKTKKLSYLILILTAVVLIFPAQEARAFLGFDVTETLGEAVLYFNGLITGLLGQLLALVADWLGSFLKLQGNYFENMSIVKESWKVFRDFSNMFFILILIVIAFATIFDMQQYNWKGLMTKFIIAALLINFSLAIGGFIIKISTTLSNVALSQFTDITANFAAGFGLNKLITASATVSSTTSLANVISGLIISSIGTIILTGIVLLAFIAALAFSVARVPILWALLIVSPVAWIASILPQTRKIWSNWWTHFLCWTFFMPAYLFGLVMGLAILANRPDIETVVNLSEGTGLAAVGKVIGFTVQDIFFYILTVIILMGALAGSMKMACAAGSGAVKTFGAISGRVNKFARDRTGYTALKKGLTEKAAEIQKTGLLGKLGVIYGGERAEKLKEARVAEGIFGKRGAIQAEKDRAMREDIKTYKERFKATTNVDELKKNMQTGPREQKLAIAELLKERGELKASEMKGVFDLYREAGSDSNAIEYAKGIDYDKLSKDERGSLYESLGSQNAEVARKIVLAQAEKGDWKSEGGTELTKKLKEHASLFTQSGEKIEFLNKVKKFNMEEAIKAGVDLDLNKPKEDEDPVTKEKIPWTPQNLERKYTKAMEGEIRGMSLDKMSELSVDALDKLTKNPTTAGMISRKITADNIASFEGKLTENQLDALGALKDDGILKKRKDEIAKEKKEAAEKAAELQAESLAKALQKSQQQILPPSRPAGFTPPGSKVGPGGVVTKAEHGQEINPNNVLDLRNNKDKQT